MIIWSVIKGNVKCVCFALRSVGVLRKGDLRELVITGSVIIWNFYCIRAGIKRYLRLPPVNRNVDILNGESFATANRMATTVARMSWRKDCAF